MKETHSYEILDRFGAKMFIGVIVAAYVVMVVETWGQWTAVRLATMLILGGIYTYLFLYVWPHIYYRGWLVLTVYFVVQIVLTTAAQFTSNGAAGFWLLPLPLIAQAVELSMRWGLAAIVGVWLAWIGLVINWSDGDWRLALSNSLLFMPALLFTAVLSRGAIREEQARRRSEQLAAELRQANQQLRTYAAQIEELATSKERNRLAREIHDSLGHYLTVVNVQLEAAKTVMDSDPARAHDALSKAQQLTQQGLGDIRRSVAALRESPLDDRPLSAAVAGLVEESNAAGILTELAVEGRPRDLPAQTTLTLYRTAQEALTNVRKHARASRVDLCLDYTAVDTVALIVEDNGVGTASANGGFGLLGVRERVQLLGGNVEIESGRGQGFRLEVRLPG